MQPRPVSARAFTLVEIMVAVGVFTLLSAGLLRMFIGALNIYAYDSGKLRVNQDIRDFTTEMTENATYANYFLIFPSYASISRADDTLVNPADPGQGYTTDIVDNKVEAGKSGDCLVLVYNDPADRRKIARLVLYFRAPANPKTPRASARSGASCTRSTPFPADRSPN